MGFFDGFSSARAIATLVAARTASVETNAAALRLAEIGRSATPKVLEALPRDQGGLLTAALVQLITTAGLPTLVSSGLLGGDPQVASAVRRALLAAKGFDPNRLIELVLMGGGNPAEIGEILLSRREAVGAKSVLRLLEQAKADPQPGIFNLIDQLATADMLASLVGFLKSAEWQGRQQIAGTIARFPSEASRDALLCSLKDPHKLVRLAALEGLAALNMPVPIGPVCELLRDSDMTVQSKAIDVAIQLNDPDAVRHLVSTMQDESEHVRRAAVEVLNAVGNASAIKDLLTALKDQDWWVRVRAADALGAIGGPKVIDAVLQLLGDEDEFMRRTAVEILNTTKDARAYDYLTKALQDPDWWVRERAIDALANLGDTRAVPALIDILTSDSQASGVAIRALASLGDSIAAEPVLNCLGSSDESVQREALEALPTLASNKNWKSIAERLRAFAPADASLHDAAQRCLTEVQARFSARGAPRRTNTLPAGRSPNASAAGMTSLSKQLGDDATADRTMEVTTTSPSEVPAAATQTAAAAVAAASQASDMLDFGAIYAGQILGGRYKVARELGRGGFGTVLQVEDQMVGEVIALKLINPQLVRDESAISRFIHEVRYARKITHENVIRIHDFLMVGKVYAMSMEYFASHPLARRLRRGLTQNPNLALKFVRDIARGIQVAHNADIVHRDLKPANILVDDNDLLKVVDFGLAAAVSHADSRVTKTGHLVGTPTYMAPEQARGLDIDGRTDIYSLGVIMYEMFTGAPPYAGDNPLAVMYQHIEGNKVPPRERNPALAPAMEALILKAMALRPEDRYQSMKALLDDAEGLNLKVTA